MGAASTLHRVSRLEKEGTQEPPRPASPLLTPTPPRVASACTSPALTEPGLKLKTAIIPRQKGLLLERRPVLAELLSARLSPAISVTDVPVKVPCPGGEEEEEEAGEGGRHLFSHTHLLRRAAFGAM